ncbi:MAG: hypothetical protein ACFB0C_00890 [Leptolyngbyaceae cyanobacterium]
MDYSNRSYTTAEGIETCPCSAALAGQLQASLAEQAAPWEQHNWDDLIQTFPALASLEIQREASPTPNHKWKVICRPQLMVDLAECTTRMAATDAEQSQQFWAIAQTTLTAPSMDPAAAAAGYCCGEAELSKIYRQPLPEFPAYHLFYTLYYTETWVSFMSYEREYFHWYMEVLRLLPQDSWSAPQ